jgi:hypothetical protein
MKKIYISGKISGLEESVYTKNFKDAEVFLLTQNPQNEIVNPLNIKPNGELTWENYMKADLKEMLDCDCLFMLKNWRNSRGAIVEHNLAKDLNIEIIYQ